MDKLRIIFLRAGRLISGIGLAVGLLFLAACGSDDGNNQTITPAVSPSPRPTLGAATQTPPAAATPTALAALRDPLAGHALGPDNAPVTFILYADFQCTMCARYARDLEIVRARYPDEIRLIWRHLPDLRTHDKAALALQASEAAAAQGLFWEMHDQLFTHQSEWLNLSPDDFRAALDGYAATVGLDSARFAADLDAQIYAPMIDEALRDAADLGLVGTPMLLVNGIPYSGRDDRFGLEEAARLALLEQRHFDAPPEMSIDPAEPYRATIVTEQGEIVINLFAAQAPVTVNNFVFLARAGWYDTITFHYVVPGFIAQVGDPSGTGRGTPGYTIPDEANNGLTFDRPGLVAMAHPPGVPNSAGSQFFITMAALEPAAEWNGQYTIFGEVVAGMDLVQKLRPRNANDSITFPNPPPGDYVTEVRIEGGP